MKAILIIQVLCVLLTGLVAGLLYSYDCSVTKGLGSLPDDSYLLAFQSINKAIQNLYFFTSFMGCLLLLPVTTWLTYRQGNTTAFYYFLAATLVYFIGVMGVTMFGNVPLNNQLTFFNIATATKAELTTMRGLFEVSWNRWHTIRTIASIVSFGLAIIAIVKSRVS
ncbi:MAG: hypothetical protein JWQ38_1030 [Flavipsychrobacter sp.]|nr:hypothetical protein [Flavipsychrobacter sp.]